jgi:precorrin-6B methylase 2
MMGHGLRASSQSELVDKLIARGFLSNVPPVVETAFRETDRAPFLPRGVQDIYCNLPQEIGSKHFMSTPQLHAQVLSLLASRLGPNGAVGEIGAGTGYLPGLLSRCGCLQVFAIEKDQELLDKCRKNLDSFPNVLVSHSIPPNVSLDALYVAPFLEGYDDLLKLLEPIKWSEDAVVVASVIDESSFIGPIKDQQMLLLRRRENSWEKTQLFRTLCEPLAS